MNLTPKKIKEISEKTSFNFKNPEAKASFENYAKINKFNSVIVDFIVAWGKCMQYAIKKENLTVAQAAEDTCIACGSFFNLGASSFNYALFKTAEFWSYGDELKAWAEKESQNNI